MVKVRLGKGGKPTEFNNPLLNVKAHFGTFALLLNSRREVIPLSISGEPVEPLKENELYTIELPSQKDMKHIEKIKHESKKLFKQRQDEKLKAMIIENDPNHTLDHDTLLRDIEEMKRERLKIARKQKKMKKEQEAEEEENCCVLFWKLLCCRLSFEVEEDEEQERLLSFVQRPIDEIPRKGQG